MSGRLALMLSAFTLSGSGPGGIGLPPANIRSDQIIVPLPGSTGVRLRFVGCPFAPFVDTAVQNVCQAL